MLASLRSQFYHITVEGAALSGLMSAHRPCGRGCCRLSDVKPVAIQMPHCNVLWEQFHTVCASCQ